MKLDVRSLALTLGLLWGAMMLVVGLVSAATGMHEGGYYGSDFMLVMASLYPGYDGLPEYQDAVIGALYGLVDGVVAGALVALIYNGLARKSSPTA